jgi:hypothetical protein
VCPPAFPLTNSRRPGFPFEVALCPAGLSSSLARAMRICQPPLNSLHFLSYCSMANPRPVSTLATTWVEKKGERWKGEGTKERELDEGNEGVGIIRARGGL